MAEPNISLLGATYSGVKGVTLPKSGGGTATFPWVEGSETKTANGTYDVTNLAQLIVNVSGGGGSGLVYEKGTFSPTTDTTTPSVTFSNTHTNPPFFIMVSDTTGTVQSTSSSVVGWIICVYQYAFGGSPSPATSTTYYGRIHYQYRGSNNGGQAGNNLTSLTNSSSTSGVPYYCTATGFSPKAGTYYYRSGRTYSWVAVFGPVT